MTRPNPHIALIYHYDLARALAGEVVDWQAIPVNVDAGREGGDLCRAAADFAKRRDLFAMPAPKVPTVVPEIAEFYDRMLDPQSAVPVGRNPAVEQQTADPEPSTASTAAPGPAANEYRFPAGPHLYEVCEKCNYNTHRCPFCGDDLTHAEDVNGTHIRSCYTDEEREHDRSPHHRDRLRARIAHLVATWPTADPELRRLWPEGVPTLKHDGHTDAQLQLILACVRRVEAEVGSGWHPDDGPPPHVNTDPRASIEYPLPVVPDEGGIAGAPETFALDLRYNALDADGKELCKEIAREAHAAGRSISVTADPTMRKVRIARAVIAWAASGRTLDDLWWAASEIATANQCQDPGITLGGFISQFTIEQADRLYEAASQ